ncbi:MAG: hypothetical protein LQ339_007031 [Xanthoria mediterranea]|nr:MAG: hypothetical protein LQ339_007031 [Xanthoria mediterranea]
MYLSFLLLISLLHPLTTSATTTPSIPPATLSTLSYKNPTTFKSTLLKTHNTYRTPHNASSLTWNTTLATAAALHAQPCKFTHSKTGGSVGENLAAGYPNTTAAVEGWGDERQKYDFKNAEFGEKTAHFTQMVWKATTDVGCGAAWCDGQGGTPGWYLVCQYFPAGNVVGAFKQNVEEEVKASGAARALTVWRVESWWFVVGSIIVGFCAEV